MRMHNQMIKREYEPDARILYDLLHDPEFLKVKAFSNDKERLYQAVRNDYYIRSKIQDQVDFFNDPAYYEKLISAMSIEAQLGVGMAEQNMILYHVNKIIDTVYESLKNYRSNNHGLMNIGFIGIDIKQQQLFLTDLENHCNVCFQLMIERDINQMYGVAAGFQYHIRFRFLRREVEES